MRDFQKSRITLLDELEELVTKSLTRGHDFETRDERRENRKLKLMRKEIDKWKKELKSEEKLRQQTRQEMEENRKRVEEYYATDPSNRDQ